MVSFHKLIDSFDYSSFFIDANLKILYVNQAFVATTGIESKSCLGLSFEKLIAHADLDNFNLLINELQNTQDNRSVSITIKTKNGGNLIIDLSIFQEKTSGQLTGYSGFFTINPVSKITQSTRHKNLDSLAIEEKYKTLYNLTFEGVIIHDKGVTIDANPAFEKMTGYSREESIGSNIVQLCVLPDYHKIVINAMKNDITAPYEVLARRKDGVVLYAEVESRRIELNARSVRVTAIRDITARKVAENRLKESEERYRLLSNITFEGIFLHKNGIIIDANQSLANMIGYDIEEILGRNIIQLVVLPEYHQRVATALKNEEVNPYVVKVRRKNGSVFYAEVEAGMVNYKDEWLRVTAARDVTWRIEAERKLRENEEELNTFFSQSGDGFFIMKLDEPVVWNAESSNEDSLLQIMAKMYLLKINEAMIRQYRTHESKIKGYTLKQFFDWNDLYGKNFTKELLNKGSVSFEMAEPRFDNSIMWIEGNYLVLYDEAGKVRGCCGVRREISDRKKAEEKMKLHNEALRKANQELDNFVYRVSHDLKAPISSAKGLINIAQIETEKGRINTCLELMKDSMNRLDSFILDILDYSRNSRTEVVPSLINFDELIKDTLSHTRFLQQESRIVIEYEIIDSINFYSDKRRLVFIFNNLISNAIRFADEEKSNSYLKIVIENKSDHISIIFSDNGIGIPKEHLDRIFDMFYRANEQRVGSGLGLYIVKESVDKLHGSIKVESETGKGTRFLLEIPNLVQNE
jgi:PAS domain S-box-containing protein